MRNVEIGGGERVAALGQGTWTLGEGPRRSGDETAALREGVALGMTLIDTPTRKSPRAVL